MKPGDRVRLDLPWHPDHGRLGTVRRVEPAFTDKDGEKVPKLIYVIFDGSEYVLPWRRKQLESIG